MISDFVKGKKKFDYPVPIQKGIALHRTIDSFTDQHEATKEAKEIFRPAYRLYSGAFVDVVYDHFLATDMAEFSEESLLHFSLQVCMTHSLVCILI
jgi:acyl carrier protein phosphodiesterase